MWRGRSPFERPTYRYTPILALLLTPNLFIHPAFGKLLFAAVDLIVGLQLHAILRLRKVPPPIARRCMAAWLFNPLSLNVSTRGNSESTIALLILAAIHALLSRKTASAGAWLAAAVHMKPYPIIYLPAFLACIDADYASATDRTKSLPPWLRPWRARFIFLFTFSLVSFTLFLSCLLWCGEEYWREALVYHLTRIDTRHNFSPYWYPLYLTTGAPYSSYPFTPFQPLPEPTPSTTLLASFAFIPQASLLLALAYRYGRDLPFCLFVSTVLFVTLNKVCTAQYFIWYHSLLPLILPSTAALSKLERKRTALVVCLWVGTLVSWLAIAFQLEFRRRHVFTALWMASLSFFAANLVVVREAIRLHTMTPLFGPRGGVARQACVVEQEKSA